MRRLVFEAPVGPHVVPVFETDEPIIDPLGNECDSILLTPEPVILLASYLVGPARWVALIHELAHARTVLLDLPELPEGLEEPTCTGLANIVTQALGRYLGPPPGERPPWPEPMDDEKTPTVEIPVIRRKEDMPP